MTRRASTRLAVLLALAAPFMASPAFAAGAGSTYRAAPHRRQRGAGDPVEGHRRGHGDLRPGHQAPELDGHIQRPHRPGDGSAFPRSGQGRENAGVLVPVTATSSPFTGEATLDDAKAADLEAGRLYFNIHTAANPKGEIRGQLELGALIARDRSLDARRRAR
ncbi:CHRD domain-containing protein [Methylobacterium oryzae CBMB20]